MECKTTIAALDAWLTAYLEVTYPGQRFYVGGPFDLQNPLSLSYTCMGGSIGVLCKRITTERLEVTVAVRYSQRADWPNGQAMEAHALALREAIRKHFRPAREGAVTPWDDTELKLEELRKLRRAAIRDRVKLTWTKACGQVGIDPETARKHAPELRKRWNDKTYGI